VLHFSLLRFVYDLTSMERKKSKHVISFPTHLDMNQFLRPQERSSKMLMYDLRGVLLHKGVSAYHGHYEAQVFDIPYAVSLKILLCSKLTIDPRTASWYQFNDEVVTKIESLGARPPDYEVVDVDEEGEQERKPYVSLLCMLYFD
jgi:Ubiquitin carboxyl-terminal hydrolase